MATGYAELLQQWGEGMLRYQIDEFSDPSLQGALMCPACGLVHGRCHEAVYPLLCLADLTGEEKYLTAARKLAQWSDTLTTEDGAWLNDFHSDWKGTTVFGVISLAEALKYHGHLLEKTERFKLSQRLKQAADFLIAFKTLEDKIINYPSNGAAALALAGAYLNEPCYLARAEELLALPMSHFTPNDLFYGEGDPRETITPKGACSLDLGYNVEESLPAMVLYAKATGNNEVLQKTVASMRAHLAFMLPDGGWDNSFGTRLYKWTYWGSRTTDGCQTAYALLAEQDELFAEAAWRNLQLLADCTHDGLLYGGPHYHRRGLPPCIHHTFTHAKMLAGVLDHGGGDPPKRRLSLPMETAEGLQTFEEAATHLASAGKWRATVTEYDYCGYGHHATGGTMSLLYHLDAGLICCCGPLEFINHEPANQQRDLKHPDVCLTPRIEHHNEGGPFMSASDAAAKVTHREENGEIVFLIEGRLTALDFKTPSSIDYRLSYRFGETQVEIVAECDAECELIVPIISSSDEAMRWDALNIVTFAKQGGSLQVETGEAFEQPPSGRVFNATPGHEAALLKAAIRKGQPTRMVLRFAD